MSVSSPPALLARDSDGYLARYDRRLSLAMTRLLLPLPVTPNQITAAGLVLSLFGAWRLAAPARGAQLTGALTLWLGGLLDGCDGEIARLKSLATDWGAAFDLWADHLAHLATFIALPVGLARLHPHEDWRRTGTLLVTGVAASAYAVWRLVLSVPEGERGPRAVFVERVASRDYVYLLVVLAALGRLEWFVEAAAVGAHAFWIWLWISARRPAAGRPR